MIRMSTLYRKLYLAVLGFALLVFGAVNSALAVQVERYTINETAHDAAAIFVGRVTGHQSRWGDDAQRWMVTDYTFQIDDVILSAENVQRGQSITMSFWGGTLGEETQSIAGFHPPEDGARYVLMLRPDWETAGLTPLVAFDNGLFKIIDDPSTGRATLSDADGQPLIKSDNDQVERSTLETGALQGQSGISLDEFVNYLRANIARIKALPGRQAPQIDPNDPNVMPTFALQGVVEAAGAETGANVPLSPDGSSLLSAPVPLEDSVGSAASSVESVVAGSDESIQPQWVRFAKWSSLPVVVNSFPNSFPGPWFPEDQYQMSKWNYYADIFRVRVPRTGTYGWPNGINDLAGWPSSADLQRVYGSPWGAGVLGVTFTRSLFGFLLEADIALNPAYGWTVNDEAIYLGTTGAQAYRATMLHEMGHMWGLDHNFNFLSIMNYSPAPYRAYCIPFMDDAEAVRATYPGALQNRTDLGAYMFRSAGFQNWAQATFPGSVVAGNGFFLNNFHIENVGTSTINSPTLEFYLTRGLNFNPGTYYFLRTVSYSPPRPRFTYYFPSSVGVTLTVPTGVPGGDYHVADFIRNDGGASVGNNFPFSNNFGFTRAKIRVYPRLTSVGLNPQRVSGGSSSVGRVFLGSTAGPGGLTVFLSSSNPSVATVPGSVFIPAGSSSAAFNINTSLVPITTNVLITASSNGINQSATLTVTAGTGIDVDDVFGSAGDTVTLSATLTRNADGVGLGGKTLAFYLEGSFVGTGTTDGTGLATLDFTIPGDFDPGDYTVTVNFDGDSSYEDSSGAGILTVSE